MKDVRIFTRVSHVKIDDISCKFDTFAFIAYFYAFGSIFLRQPSHITIESFHYRLMCTALRHSQWDSLLISSNERKREPKFEELVVRIKFQYRPHFKCST